MIETDGARLPVGVFKFVYVLLLVVGLYDVGKALASSTPVYILAIPGEGNAVVGHVLYLSTLVAAGFFVFAAYMSFEAFEVGRGPFDDIRMPQSVWPRILEISLRLSLVAMLTLKVWHMENDRDASAFVAIVAPALLAWTLVVRHYYRAAVSQFDVIGTLVLTFFAIGLLWFSADIFRATYFGLAAVIIMTVFALALIGFGGWLLSRVAGELFDEVGVSVRRLFRKQDRGFSSSQPTGEEAVPLVNPKRSGP